MKDRLSKVQIPNQDSDLIVQNENLENQECILGKKRPLEELIEDEEFLQQKRDVN